MDSSGVGCDSAAERVPRAERPSMSTLFLSHPAALDHQTPPGHPERPDRIAGDRAGARGRAFRRARPRAGAARHSGDGRARPSGRLCRRRSGRRRRSEGMSALDADTTMSPGTLRGGAARRRRRRHAVDEVMSGEVGNAFSRCARPAITPSRHRDGLLLLQQCRHRRAPRAQRAWRRARRDRRFRRPSRQRHAGHLLGRPDVHVLLDPSDAALSRHRRAQRARRARQHRQRAAAAPATAATTSARRSRPRSCRGSRASRPTSSSSRPGSTRTGAIRSRNLNLAEADFAWATQKLMELAESTRKRARRLGARRRLRPRRAVAKSVAAHVTALMGA